MKKILVLLFAIAMMPTLQSCKKDNEEPEPSAKELLTKDKWNFVKVESYDSSGNLTDTDTPDSKLILSPSDDYFFLDDNGDLTEYGTWKLKDNNSKFQFIEHNNVYDNTFDIEKLTDKKFNISVTDSAGKSILYFER